MEMMVVVRLGEGVTGLDLVGECQGEAWLGSDRVRLGGGVTG